MSTPYRATVEFDSEQARDEFLHLCRYSPETWPVKIRRVAVAGGPQPADLSSAPTTPE